MKNQFPNYTYRISITLHHYHKNKVEDKAFILVELFRDKIHKMINNIEQKLVRSQ